VAELTGMRNQHFPTQGVGHAAFYCAISPFCAKTPFMDELSGFFGAENIFPYTPSDGVYEAACLIVNTNEETLGPKKTIK
jgi:hypothetical protein